jgi:polyisoprenoid-binding protein YceI
MTTSTPSRVGIPTGTWKVDKAHTHVGFAVNYMGIATVRGEFREFDGALEIGDDLTDARAYGRVDVASVDTNQAQRVEHLRSTDFFSAESHPELIFQSHAIEPVDNNTVLGVHVLPQDIANAVVHFSSEARSGKSTGNILNVDGGVSAAYPR